MFIPTLSPRLQTALLRQTALDVQYGYNASIQPSSVVVVRRLLCQLEASAESILRKSILVTQPTSHLSAECPWHNTTHFLPMRRRHSPSPYHALPLPRGLTRSEASLQFPAEWRIHSPSLPCFLASQATPETVHQFPQCSPDHSLAHEHHCKVVRSSPLYRESSEPTCTNCSTVSSQ